MVKVMAMVAAMVTAMAMMTEVTQMEAVAAQVTGTKIKMTTRTTMAAAVSVIFRANLPAVSASRFDCFALS